LRGVNRQQAVHRLILDYDAIIDHHIDPLTGIDPLTVRHDRQYQLCHHHM